MFFWVSPNAPVGETQATKNFVGHPLVNTRCVASALLATEVLSSCDSFKDKDFGSLCTDPPD